MVGVSVIVGVKVIVGVIVVVGVIVLVSVIVLVGTGPDVFVATGGFGGGGRVCVAGTGVRVAVMVGSAVEVGRLVRVAKAGVWVIVKTGVGVRVPGAGVPVAVAILAAGVGVFVTAATAMAVEVGGTQKSPVRIVSGIEVPLRASSFLTSLMKASALIAGIRSYSQAW
jgi:hypothetical protein